MVKNVKIAKGILYFTENWLSRNEKDLDSNFNLVIANINLKKKNAPNFTFLQEC